jgi:hypothetical protein
MGEHTNDITQELALLHTLSGANFSRQVEKIAHRGEFHLIDGETDIYSVGGEQSDDHQNLLVAARKAVEFGYRVYMLPNPRTIRTADFIFEKKGTYRLYDLKTVFGKSSVGQNLIDSIGQCNRILLNMTTEYSTRSLAYDLKRYFETNSKAIEVLIFRGRKRISVSRFMASNPAFFRMFKKNYER